MRVEEIHGEPRQRIHDVRGWPLPLVDLRAEPDPCAAAGAWAYADLARPLDPGTDGMVSWALLRLADDRDAVHHAYHHLVADGVGLTLVADRFAEIRTALIAGVPTPPATFPPPAELLAAVVDYRSSNECA